MTESELMQYTAIKKSVERKQSELEELQNKELTVVSGKVQSSMRQHPYIQTRTTVEMYDQNEVALNEKRIARCEADIMRNEAKLKRIEDFIDGIEDARIKIVFELRVYERKNWYDIADMMGEGKGRMTYTKMFKKFIKNS